MKRILLTNFHPHQDAGGGHTRYIRTILTSALRQEFAFGIAAPEHSAVWAMGRAMGLPTFACEFPGNAREIFSMMGAVRRFGEICRGWYPDLVHTNGSRDQAIVVFWKALQGRDIPCIRTHHALRNIPDNAYHRWSYQKMVQGHIYVGHSARNISWAGNSLKVPNGRVIPNGVDVTFWTPMPKDAACLANLGVSPTDFVFGSHAGMGSHKRTDLFLHAAALQLARGVRPFKILLLGNEREIVRSRQLAAELHLTNVLYVERQHDPRGYVSLIDVGFILSESVEASSFAARELMAMGKPLVTSNYSGFVEIVDDRLNGRLVDCGDVEGVAEAIHWFLSLDAATLAQVRGDARHKAERVFSVEHQIRDLRRFYAGHLAKAAGASGRPTSAITDAGQSHFANRS
jgi:glycosyltransferase involved in cell wall biosynthesis